MKIRLYKPVGIYLLDLFGNDIMKWESRLSSWVGFPIKLPKYFWEIHLFIINDRIPMRITLECRPEKDWFSVFYSYNLNGDLKKYIELMIIRKCRQHRNENKYISLKQAG
ncbi:MAG: hypothetical protein OEV78_12390 [Spirochaetia bacterium]|nr:hypothetical protein [Spirochaetia bacterium]